MMAVNARGSRLRLQLVDGEACVGDGDPELGAVDHDIDAEDSGCDRGLVSLLLLLLHVTAGQSEQRNCFNSIGWQEHGKVRERMQGW